MSKKYLKKEEKGGDEEEEGGRQERREERRPGKMMMMIMPPQNKDPSKKSIMGVAAAPSPPTPTNVKNSPFRSTSSIKNTADWPISEVTSDLSVEVEGTNFALHKFPLVSRCGKIRKILVEGREAKISRISIASMPGGPVAFELAVKFCYGVHTDITLSNVATLNCAAHFLEMTEEFAEKNLESQTEAFLKETVFPDIVSSVSVLHNCELLLPTAEDVNLVQKIIEAIATGSIKQQLSCGLSNLEQGLSSTPKSIFNMEVEPPVDWWGRRLSVLNLHFFQKVLKSVKSKGLKPEIISKILINYAYSSLQGSVFRDSHVGGRDVHSDTDLQKKQRDVVETIVGLLPPQSRKSTVPMAFLSTLLKHAMATASSSSCRADVEKRMGLQLDRAILEDILIPAVAYQGNNPTPLYDADPVSRIFSIFLNLDDDEDEDDERLREELEMAYDYDSPESPKQSSIIKVSKLLDSYLAEVALDLNVPTSKFVALAELLPDHARLSSDGLYRAVDTFLKGHPGMKESERYRMCKTIECQKLSPEACSHAAQNERLPVQVAVQVLFFEQMRLRNAVNGGGGGGGHSQFLLNSMTGQFPQRSVSGTGSGAISPRDNYASVRRENKELKLEVARMRMRLTDLEKDHVSMKQEMVRTVPANNIFKSLTRKLRKLHVLFRMRDLKSAGSKAASDSRFLFQKRRRHSVS